MNKDKLSIKQSQEDKDFFVSDPSSNVEAKIWKKSFPFPLFKNALVVNWLQGKNEDEKKENYIKPRNE